MKKIKIGTVFSGIGSFEQALKIMGIEHEIIFACDNGEIEIDFENYEKLKENFDKNIEREKIYNLIKDKYKLSRKQNFVEYTYKANYDIESERFYYDIRFFNGIKYKNKIDILVGGSPCQSFSSVGNKGGLEDTRGTLFYEFARIVLETKPKVFIYENVRGLLTHDKGNTWKKILSVFKALGYNITYKVIDSKEMGIAQTRRRIFVIGYRNELFFKRFKFPDNIKLRFLMKDYLLDNNGFGSFNYTKNNINFKKIEGAIPQDCFLSEKLVKYVMCSGTGLFYQKPEIDLNIARTVLKTMGNSHRAGIDNYVTSKGKIRRLHEREVARLMGFPDSFKIIVSRSQAYKQFGNSIVVKVFIELFCKIIESGVFNG